MEEGIDSLGDFLSKELLSFINDESDLPVNQQPHLSK